MPHLVRAERASYEKLPRHKDSGRESARVAVKTESPLFNGNQHRPDTDFWHYLHI